MNIIINSKEFHVGAKEQLENAKAKVEVEENEFRVNGYSEIKEEKFNLVNLTYKTLKQLETYKNETIKLERQRAINQVRQRIFQQGLQGTLGTFNSYFTIELHLHTISVSIDMLGAR